MHVKQERSRVNEQCRVTSYNELIGSRGIAQADLLLHYSCCSYKKLLVAVACCMNGLSRMKASGRFPVSGIPRFSCGGWLGQYGEVFVFGNCTNCS